MPILLAVPFRFCMLAVWLPAPSWNNTTPLLMPDGISILVVLEPVPCCVMFIVVLSAADVLPSITVAECPEPSCVIEMVLLSPT